MPPPIANSEAELLYPTQRPRKRQRVTVVESEDEGSQNEMISAGHVRSSQQRSAGASTSAVQSAFQPGESELAELEADLRRSSPEENLAATVPIQNNGTFRKLRTNRRIATYVDCTGPSCPRSAYEGYQPPLPISTEHDAMNRLTAAWDAKFSEVAEKPDYVTFVLDDFTIYQSPTYKRYPSELTSLHQLCSNGFTELFFDGVLTIGDERRYVRAGRFDCLTVEGYRDEEVHDLRDKICIQSKANSRTNIWYQLGQPAQEYRRFYEPFLWLAQLRKYAVDYLFDTEAVSLSNFRRQFNEWLFERYGRQADFIEWHRLANLTDFRTTVSAHVAFLWNECWSLDDNKLPMLCKHPVWEEIDPMRLETIPAQKEVETKTIVTSYVYECFKHMYFTSMLKKMELDKPEVLAAQRQRKTDLNLTPESVLGNNRKIKDIVSDFIEQVEPGSVAKGDVVCISPGSDTIWKSNSDTWFAYVQGTRSVNQDYLLDVLWLYEPHDTTLGKAEYPFANEMFLTDNCSCGKDAVNATHVVGRLEVTWSATDPSIAAGICVRQKFRTEANEGAYDFMTLKPSDFKCRCGIEDDDFDDAMKNHRIGDTVLVRQYDAEIKDEILNPAQILKFDLNTRKMVLRHLDRQQRTLASAKPNQLVMTDTVYERSACKVVRKCFVQYYTPEDLAGKRIPTPYDRDGTGDFFYIIEDDTMDRGTDDASAFPPLVRGFDPRAPLPKKTMTGLGIFCGGGNYDRGLEEGGAVKFRYAVDMAEHALHTYRANVQDPQDVNFFLGSVNDFLAQAISGSASATIAHIGEVDVISAGSPCPGFSQLQMYKLSDQSLRNASMVASVVSFVDFYCPRYCLLENVVTMTQDQGILKNESVFSQILCAMVGMGYQVQQFNMDAWSYRSPQSRSRVFVVASAPGLEPLPLPPLTHGHPREDLKVSKLGKSSNGLPFGTRRYEVTPFKFLSAQQAVADLPNIGYSQVQICPAVPDHRLSRNEPDTTRTRIAQIPRLPHGMGYVQAVRAGRMSTREVQGWFSTLGQIRSKPDSKCYSRILPDALFPTILTALQINNGLAGRTVHWEQHRPMTIMEARRAQSFPDHEVIVGNPTQQFKIIGNSVDRNVALVLGLSLRASWLGSKISSQSPSQLQTAGSSLRDGTSALNSRKDRAKVAEQTVKVNIGRPLDVDSALSSALSTWSRDASLRPWTLPQRSRRSQAPKMRRKYLD